jgi:hypothetical protein
LFSLVIDTILKQIELGENITTSLKQCTAHTDDILLTTRTKQSLLDTFQKLKETSAQYGLIVNGQKTKYLRYMRKNNKLEKLQINLMYLEQVQSYKYTGSTVNSNNSIEEQIQHRITLGNKAYYANQFFFKSRLVSKESKLKLYWSIIRPIVIYAYETWVLKETIKNKLMVFETKVFRRNLGPIKERDGTCRIKTYGELDKLIRHKNIINHIKAQRLSWFGHLLRMPEKRMIKRVHEWKPMLTRPLGIPKNRREDDIINDMKKLKIKNWTSCIQDRNKWKL